MIHLLTFTMAGTPPSSNNAYYNVDGQGRKLKPNVKEWKDRIYAHVKNQINTDEQDFRPDAGFPLAIEFTFCVKDLFKQDWDGLVKVCQDSTMEAMELDDKYIVDAHVFKVENARPSFTITVWRIS